MQGRTRTRIDRIYASEKLKQRIIQYKIIPNFHSDHDGIQITITWGRQISWGKGIWKMNTSLLDDQEFNNRITGLIQSIRINKQGGKSTDPKMEWENLKYKIKSIAISRSTEIRKEDNNRKQNTSKRNSRPTTRNGEWDQRSGKK